MVDQQTMGSTRRTVRKFTPEQRAQIVAESREVGAIGTAQLNGLNVEAYLRQVLERLPDHPVNRIDELLPWNLLAEQPEMKLAA